MIGRDLLACFVAGAVVGFIACLSLALLRSARREVASSGKPVSGKLLSGKRLTQFDQRALRRSLDGSQN